MFCGRQGISRSARKLPPADCEFCYNQTSVFGLLTFHVITVPWTAHTRVLTYTHRCTHTHTHVCAHTHTLCHCEVDTFSCSFASQNISCSCSLIPSYFSLLFCHQLYSTLATVSKRYQPTTIQMYLYKDKALVCSHSALYSSRGTFSET